MIYYVLDLYPSDDPKDGARLCRLGTLQSAEITGEANGSGQGRFTTRSSDTTAQFLDPVGLQYIRVRRVDTTVVDGATLSGFSELVVMGFFTDSGGHKLLDERGTRRLEWGGAGTLVYYSRGVMDFDSWLTVPFIGTDPQSDGTWPLHLAGTGNELGAILWRVLRELEEAGRHQNPVPAMTIGFTHLVDSNGASWVRETGDFVAQVSDNIIDIIQRLMEMGLYVEVDPDTFEINAYEPETHRRDRTGGSWGTNVVRFQAPTGGDITTGNIESDLTRGMEAKVRRNALLVGSKDTWEWVTDPGVTVPWEGGKIIDDEDGTALLKVGEAQLIARGDAGDTIRLRMKLGDDPANGFYLPFEHIKLDDLVTVHTGTGPLDFDEATFPVAALTLILRPGGDWESWVDLGSTYFTIEQRAFQAQPVGAHTHPPNPQLCRPGQASSPTLVSSGRITEGSGDGSLIIPAGLVDSMLVVIANASDLTGGGAPWDGEWTVGATVQNLTSVPGGTKTHSTADALGKKSAIQALYLMNPTAAPDPNDGILSVEGTWKGYFVFEHASQIINVVTAEGTDSSGELTIATGTGVIYINGVGVNEVGTGTAPTVVAGQIQSYTAGTNTIEHAGGYGDSTPGWTFAGSRLWVGVGMAVQGVGTLGDGHADLIGTSIRAKRCDDTEHYHTTADPTANDDTSLGFRNNTLWINETTGEMFLLLDNAEGAADWLPVGGAGTDLSAINFLVGTASGDLSAEIVVGTTPGGELGNTWANPTVDATHAGSNHLQPVRKNSAGSVFERRRLNLIEGSNVTLTVADDAGNDEVDITVAASLSGSGLTVEDEGTPLATDASTLNFTGAGVTATGAGATKTIDIPGGGSGAQIMRFDPGSAPGSPEAEDDEFEDASISGSLTRVAHGTPKGSWAEDYGRLSWMETASMAAGEMDVYANARTVSVGDYVEVSVNRALAHGNCGVAVGFSDGTTYGTSNALASFTKFESAISYFLLNRWPGHNTRTNDGTTLAMAQYQFIAHFYLRVKYEAANTWGLYLSLNGHQWHTIQTNFSYTMTPTHVIFGVGADTSNAPAWIMFDYVRVNAT